jgi:hypothetical protein
MTVHKMGSMWKEAIGEYFKAQSLDLLGGTEENLLPVSRKRQVLPPECEALAIHQHHHQQMKAQRGLSTGEYTAAFVEQNSSGT